MPGEATHLSPQQAAQALADLAGFEDHVSSRVGALTGMVWGIVSAAIFVTYGMAEHIEPKWLLPLLWLPWTVAGVVVTVSAWKLHAVSLGRPHDRRRSVLWTVGFAAVFLVAMALLYVLDLDVSAFPYMLVVNGGVGLFIASHIARHHGWLAGTPMLAAGLVIIGGAFLLATANLSTIATGLSSAALVGTAFLVGSLVSFLRG